MTRTNNFISPKITTGILLISIALISFIAYHDTLGYSFFGSGTLPYIKNQRIYSFSDALDLLRSPIDAGFISLGYAYYRPTTGLSFGIDHAIWGLNPFGYHLTNLLLHTLIAFFVFLTTRIITGGRNTAAWISSVIFLVHPNIMETLPVIARRHNILVALFLLLSIYLFLKYFHSTVFRKTYILLSLFFYVIALGAKESAILVMPIIFVYVLFLQQAPASFKERALNTLKGVMPYILTTIIFVFWRAHILGEVGGNFATKAQTANILKMATSSVWIVKEYLVKLIYPFDFLSLRSFFDFFPYKSILIILLLGALIIYKRNEIISYLESTTGKNILFLLIWLFLPTVFCIYLLSPTSHRCMYIAIIPFSIIMSILITESVEHLTSKVNECRSRSVCLYQSLFNSIITSIIIVVFCASLIAYSPLFRKYREWEAMSDITHTVLNDITGILPQLPEDAVIHIYNLPVSIIPYRNEIPHSEEVSVLAGFSIQAWIDLVYPENRMKVIKEGDVKLASPPESVEMEVERKEGNEFNLTINYGYKAD